MPILIRAVAETSRFGVLAALVPGLELPHRPQGRRQDVLLGDWEWEIPLNSPICHWFNRLCLQWPRHHVMVAGFNWPVPLPLPSADRQAAQQLHVHLLILPNGVVYPIAPVNAEGSLEAIGGNHVLQPVHQAQVHVFLVPNGAEVVCDPPNGGNLEEVVVFGGVDGDGGSSSGGGGGHNVVQPLQDS